MNINLHIERLVLDGIDVKAGERHLLQASVATELTQLLSQDGLAGDLVGGGDLSRVAGGGIQLSGNQPKVVGRQIAQSVYGGISRE